LNIRNFDCDSVTPALSPSYTLIQRSTFLPSSSSLFILFYFVSFSVFFSLSETKVCLIR
jgi:hypothetical protein